MNELPTSAPRPPQRRPLSPALLVFLAIPLLGIVAAVIVIAGQPGGNSSVTSTPAPVVLATVANVVDAPVIDFTLPTLDGGTVRLSDLNGRIVFLNFWATWCEPCKRELPAMMEFQAANAGATDPVILAVNYGDSSDQINTFLRDNGISGLQIALDSHTQVADQYGVYQLPVTFVIDQQGIVRYPKYGEMTLDDMNSYVQALGG